MRAKRRTLVHGHARRRPPAGRGGVSHVVSDSFMMMRRNLWKSFALRMGLVNRSARLLAVRTVSQLLAARAKCRAGERIQAVAEQG